LTASSVLLALQDLDLAVAQLEHRRAHLPERAALTAVDARAAEVLGEKRKVEQERAQLMASQSEAEGELATAEQRAAALDRRLYGGEVGASRDMQAVADEIGHLKQRSSEIEDRVLELMDRIEPLSARLSELDAELQALGLQRSETTARLQESESGIDVELAELRGERTRAAAAVPDQLRATYERLRARLGGVGVARLVGNHCDGCHLTLSAVELDKVRHLPEGELFTCEQCSRILVP
jgi:predicted  nucleic acid-binding Zn-ribbon protein